MKHILNDLSEQEKNSIREQHKGGKKIVIENFTKLLNAKLGDTKPFLTESTEMENALNMENIELIDAGLEPIDIETVERAENGEDVSDELINKVAQEMDTDVDMNEVQRVKQGLKKAICSISDKNQLKGIKKQFLNLFKNKKNRKEQLEPGVITILGFTAHIEVFIVIALFIIFTIIVISISKKAKQNFCYPR